jgi:ligand-binding SRPBCC domain-containing protein
MGAITPPPVIVQVHSAPPVLSEGDRMEFTLWLGPLPVRWLAGIEQVTNISFLDRQIAGPFRRWEHLHTYLPVGPAETSVIDEVTVELADNWFWRLFGLGMWLNLPVLFAFRGWKTRQLLERTARTGELGSSAA